MCSLKFHKAIHVYSGQLMISMLQPVRLTCMHGHARTGGCVYVGLTDAECLGFTARQNINGKLHHEMFLQDPLQNEPANHTFE